MSHLDLAAVPEYLQSRRWFAGKAWPIKSITVVDHADFELEGRRPGESFVLAVVEVSYEMVNKVERYLMPVSSAPGGPVTEALESDEFARALLDLIRRLTRLPSAAGVVRGEHVPQADPLLASISERPAVRRIAVEQTNTSVVFDERVILKVIRRLEPGLNPEYEIGRFLATRTRFRATPALLGALQLEGPADATLAVLHHFVPNQGDGWRYVLGALRASPEPSDELLEALALLGTRTGELHLALASDPDDPAFAPEPIQVEDLQRWSSSIIGELGVTIAA